MQCPNCQKEISQSAKICGYCGTKLSQTGSSSTPPVEQPTPIKVNPPFPRPSEPVRDDSSPEPQAQPTPPPFPPKQPKTSQPIQHHASRSRQPLPKWAWWLIGIPLAIGLNYLFGFLYNNGFLIVLDMFGTVVITILLGPIAGMIAGAGLCLLSTITYFEYGYYFIPVHLIFALGTWLTHRFGWFKNVILSVLGGLVTNLLANLTGSLIYMVGFLPSQEQNFHTWWQSVWSNFTNPASLQVPGLFLLVWLGLRLFHHEDK
jgi:hypothetical protein